MKRAGPRNAVHGEKEMSVLGHDTIEHLVFSVAFYGIVEHDVRRGFVLDDAERLVPER